MRLLLLLCLALCAGFAAAGEAKAPSKIAVLRLKDLIINYKPYLARLEGMKKDQAEAEANLKTMTDQVRQYENQLGVLSQANERYAKLVEELEVLKVRRKLFADRIQADLTRRSGVLVKESFDALRGLLKEFCQERGIMLVCMAPNPELVPGSSELELQVALQSTLYFDPSLDLTDAFLAFANARGVPEAAPPPPEAKPAPPAVPAPVAPGPTQPAPGPAQPLGK
jgi:Skp family chaperone for outer membrane proteins